IKDNGIGMSKEIRKKIFDPFFTTKPVGKGTGLGMSITFSIINDHRGTITLHTEHYVGTEFIIELPIDYKN
ncbi:MAG TPA: ATP-binding protein, partial [Cytophaga sp.]|nr:ATP-binding protein [Cytophaga sp.]